MKKLIIFDLDGTLTASKAPLDAEMAGLLSELLAKTKVAVISGAAFHQFENQFLKFISCPAERLENLFVVPTNGSAMYHFKGGEWQRLYAEELNPEERKKIIEAFGDAFIETGFVPEKNIYGEMIEDRGTQVTFSGLGQLAPVELKKAWDPDKKKRMPIKVKMDVLIPEFEVRVNSSSSIDVTRKGIDKAYGVYKLEKHLGVGISDMVFVGDAIFPGGNDYDTVRTGVETRPVKDEKETKEVIKKMLDK